MAEETGERLVVMLEARISEFEKRMVKAEQTGTRTYRQLTAGSSRATKNMEQDMLRSTVAINRSLAQTSVQIGSFAKAFAVGIAGSAAFRSVSKAAQEFTSLQNALKVTGLEGAALDKVFSSLFQIAQKNGTAIEPLVTLYSRASQAQKELKANSADLMKFTDGVSIALRVAGTNSTQAAGALLQLSQAIGSGVVRAEEFNSVNEGARPILQAVAAGLKEAGGSVSALKTLVNDGKVSSEAFFRAFLAGMPQIEAQAAKADGTIGQASARIGNAFIALVGHLDKTTGASGNAAQGLNAVAGVVEKLGGYFDAASGKLETLQKWLTSVGNNSAWTTIAKFFGADFSPEEMAKYGLTPVGATPATPARVVVTGGTTEAPKVNPVSLTDFKVPGKAGSGAAATRDPFERSNDQIAKRIELLKVEAATIDQTAAEQDRARVVVEMETAAKQANERAGKKNVEVTGEQRAKIEALADAYAKARGELERLNSPLASFARESADVGQQLERLAVGSLDRIADDFGEIVTGTKTVEEAFKSMARSILAELAKIAVKQAVLGPLANLMGGGGSGGGILSALIPKFANGTDNAPGGLAIVGERGPELVNLPRGSQVIPHHQIGSAGGGGDINVPVMVNIDATGADAAGLARVQRQVADLKANLPGLAVQAIQSAKNRRVRGL
ncbi:hypothetical protein Nwi_1615 [Nitrobacter winogradskyi Nb-255]|uniref:Uncharacterized protein n=1 Tax=Nitrobacter winogradskyi (strain ATCC 25391 / DSM 10237 / CIP 104748 / NCIMB 11846 / Nb-255) TaxID=323098 RepID=Q3SS65_NITWN|nr:tape measure protein [Nitrobacter winogradskyi]ABA04876.1 hypothetical protein Nwi_1615 [Nitrobacter winogradskyi Nb-255]